MSKSAESQVNANTLNSSADTSTSDVQLKLKEALGFDNSTGSYQYTPEYVISGLIGLGLAEEEETKQYALGLFSDPIRYISELVNIQLYKYQQPFFEAIIKLFGKGHNPTDSDILSGLFTRQVGKNETIANAVVFLLTMFSNLKIGLFAPTEKQAKAVGLQRVRERLKANPIFKSMITTNNKDFIELENGSSIRAFTANKNSQIEGFTLHLAIIDESQDIDDHIYYHDIVPMLAGVNGSVVKIGTSGGRGHFYNTCKDNATKKNKHFEYDYKAISKERPEYKKFVANMAKELGGYDSEEFKSQFCNKWVLGSRTFIDIAKINALINSEKKVLGNEDTTNTIYFAGLKVIEEKGHTVLVIGSKDNKTSKLNILNWYSWYGKDYPILIDNIKSIANEWQLASIYTFAEAEDSLMTDFEKKGLPIIRINTANTTKSALYKNLQLKIQCADMEIWDVPDYTTRKAFLKEMELIEQQWNDNGNLILNPPADGTKDYVDATALLCWGGLNIETLPEMQKEIVMQEPIIQQPKKKRQEEVVDIDLTVQQNRFFKENKKLTNWDRTIWGNR